MGRRREMERKEKEVGVKLYSIAELERMTSLSRSFIYKNVREGKLRAYKVGRVLRFREEDILNWLGIQELKKER